MDKATIASSYFQSLLWTALFFSIAVVLTAGEPAIVDSFRGGPPRTLFVVIVVLPFIGMNAVNAAIGAFQLYALPQALQALIAGLLEWKFEARAHFAILFALPFTAVLTWYCYDYLTSDFSFSIGAEPIEQPYQHGISLSRYLEATALQAPVTLFGWLYFDAGVRDRSRTPIVISALAIALAVGGVWGFVVTQSQFRLP
jgi:hypothetical protein